MCLAFTGIAAVSAGATYRRTIDWLSGELKALPYDSKLQDICKALAKGSTAFMSPHGLRGVLEIILTVAAVGEPFRIAAISNVDWRKRPPEARPRFIIQIHKVNKHFLLMSGCGDCVPTLERHRLRALARDTNKSPPEVMAALADINAIAAKHSRGYVSEGCWVASQVPDGRVRRSTSRNLGSHQGDIPFLIEGLDLSERIRKNFRAAPGKEIGIVQSAGAMYGPGDAVPLPPPTGEPRHVSLSGSSVVTALRSPAGDHCASIEVIQLECVLKMRCNGEVTVPFARIALSSVRPIGKAFPKPLLPWPQLSPTFVIDTDVVPRGWEYSVGYWIEDDTHHVIIPQSSRSIRNLAFLGSEDEIVIVAPSARIEFAWGEREDTPSSTVHARVRWQSRVDGTRG
jgi:hypothetical protein